MIRSKRVGPSNFISHNALSYLESASRAEPLPPRNHRRPVAETHRHIQAFALETTMLSDSRLVGAF